MPESLDDKLARAFAAIEVKLDAIEQKEAFQSDLLQKVHTKLTELEFQLKALEKPPKT